MNDLEKKIIEKIRREGPITFEKFMEMALYDPVSGYYTASGTRIGREGDFYTSSHLHPVFGTIIGKQIREMWEFMGKPREFRILEMGPGAGYICKDMLEYLRGGDFFESLRYGLIELNPLMREKQKDLLGEYAEKVDWFASLREMGGVLGCIFSNELLDAFPVHLVTMDPELQEIYVNAVDSGLAEEKGPLSTSELSAYFRDLGVELEPGYRTEVNLRIRDWLKDIDSLLREGFVLTIDYGYNTRDYYSEDRDRGTLMCYYRHEINENPLEHAGEQDITAHVNFSLVKKWGEGLGIRTIGYSSQSAFLVSLGIDEEIRELASSSKDYLFELARIKRLIMPQGMGESHMVLAQYKGSGNPVLRGFSMRNQMKYL